MREQSGIRKTYRIDLTAARDGVLVKGAGRYIKVANATDASAEISISVGQNIESAYMALKKNGSITERQGFTEFYITNTAQASKVITLILSEGPEDFDVDNPALTVDSVGSIDAPIEIELPDTVTSGEDLAITGAAAHAQLIAANADRKYAVICNVGANTARLGSAPTNTKGILLAAGATIALDGTMEWRAFSQSGTTLSRTEFTKS